MTCMCVCAREGKATPFARKATPAAWAGRARMDSRLARLGLAACVFVLTVMGWLSLGLWAAAQAILGRSVQFGFVTIRFDPRPGAATLGLSVSA